jgi:hypothetical protein
MAGKIEPYKSKKSPSKELFLDLYGLRLKFNGPDLKTILLLTLGFSLEAA